MSVRPLEMNSDQIERETSSTKPSSSCWSGFAGTLCSVSVSVPLLIWVFFHNVKPISETGPFCELLLDGNPRAAAIVSIVFIFLVFLAHGCYTESIGQLFAFVGIMLVLCASALVVTGVLKPSSFGLYHSSSPPSPAASAAETAVVTRNNSEYWRNNVKSCLCRTQACEELVYRKYFLRVYGDMDLSGYTRTDDDEVNRSKPPARDLNGTSPKNGDNSDSSQYHEVCYSKRSSGNEGNKTMCYDCYACEERYLRDKQRTLWSYGNNLSVLSLLLVVSNVIVFVAELWASCMG